MIPGYPRIVLGYMVCPVLTLSSTHLLVAVRPQASELSSSFFPLLMETAKTQVFDSQRTFFHAQEMIEWLSVWKKR